MSQLKTHPLATGGNHGEGSNEEQQRSQEAKIREAKKLGVGV
jgi:hypothetical protein